MFFDRVLMEVEMKVCRAYGAIPNLLFCPQTSESHARFHAVYNTEDRENLIPPGFETRLSSFIASIAIAGCASGGTQRRRGLGSN
jgi:hypothetical protein